jgi:hypothetical protein
VPGFAAGAAVGVRVRENVESAFVRSVLGAEEIEADLRRTQHLDSDYPCRGPTFSIGPQVSVYLVVKSQIVPGVTEAFLVSRQLNGWDLQ